MSAPTLAQHAHAQAGSPAPAVVRCADLEAQSLEGFVRRFGMQLHRVADGAAIPGSYWCDDEAGLVGHTLYVRADTPVHSLLHELCHWLCMDPGRRAVLHTNAGGEDVEEHAVCYLQCLLADGVPGYARQRCFADMDAWGYTFRLGSAGAWFERDAEDARRWLEERGLLARDARKGLGTPERAR